MTPRPTQTCQVMTSRPTNVRQWYPYQHKHIKWWHPEKNNINTKHVPILQSNKRDRLTDLNTFPVFLQCRIAHVYLDPLIDSTLITVDATCSIWLMVFWSCTSLCSSATTWRTLLTLENKNHHKNQFFSLTFSCRS